tara:strand:- start:374 stop:856 length:483 start_codon:yes stop_codon:yes gene_type:complete
MSNEFKNYINDMKMNLLILKTNKNKTIYTMKEGFFKFTVDIKNLKCSYCNEVKKCSLKKCKHLYYIFKNIYNINTHKLQFLWMNDNHNNVIKGKELVFEEDDINCPICLEDASSENINFNKVIHCLDCGKFYHKDCLKKAKGEYVCLICTNNWKPDWLKM